MRRALKFPHAIPATTADTPGAGWHPSDEQRTATPQLRVSVPVTLLLALILGALLSAPQPGVAGQQQPVIGHRIDAVLDPEAGTLHATDTITLPEDTAQFVFLLHQGLRPRVENGEAVLERIGRDGHLERFRLTPATNQPVTLRYGGRIRHPLTSVREGMGRERQQLVGTIDADGVFLTGYTGWYPTMPGALNRMQLDVRLPPGWLAVSQGAGPEPIGGDDAHVRWTEEQPQDELYLSAARFKLYRQPTPHGEAQAYLRLPDEALADRYLAATADYLARYSALIGAYPYAKFALVENFWETGYGMPSFTLLGSRVMRLPFILHSSYPHEILHNWWGNGVYVDYAAGNWAEGLTAYLSDHLNQALAGAGADYRRDQLKAYADYVRDGADFPLTAFRGRHGSASQAIGYGKMLMTLHMLRVMLGDDDFRDGLRRFFDQNRFRSADFDDLRRAFEQAGERDLAAFFAAWTTRPGAARLALDDVEVAQGSDGGYVVTGSVHQVQEDAALPMDVPVVVHAGDGTPQRVLAPFDGRTARFEVQLDAAPARVAVDPQFETFRHLLPAESPASLSNLFGAERGLMVLPAAAPAPRQRAYRKLAQAWQRGQAGWDIVLDDTLTTLPQDRAVWLFGWENAFVDAVAGAAPGLVLDADTRTLTLAGTAHTDVSTAVAVGDATHAIGWVAAATPAAVPGLARKLPHYGKYGYLTFTGDAPDNQVKGQWPPGDSALTQWLSDARPQLRMPTPSTLVSR
ncbi:M1 family aminopeptidase [uncultured Thiohalocapsa sp.]|uniref:M1 family metallopeptidase n=1 Tax=uncultured Thiohalocapsa sp. TaxID=768990 RepID=UPI0025D9A06C|nr:M1 family aminopeptidase [uncultured Thiohalocapsa sp.]